MARIKKIKKYQQPADTIEEKKLEEQKDQPKPDEQKAQPVTEPQAVDTLNQNASQSANNTPTEEPSQSRQFNVEGYGKFDIDDEYTKFVANELQKQNKTGASYDEVLNLIRQGKASLISAGGMMQGSDLMGAEKNTNVGRFFGARTKRIKLQDAMRDIEDINRRYAEMKNKPAEAKAKTKFSGFDAQTQLAKDLGHGESFNRDQWNELNLQNRRSSYGASLDKYLNSLENDWSDETHEGDKDLYNLHKGNREQIMKDFNALADVNNDGALDPNEFNEFLRKYRLNPGDLFSSKRLLTPEELADKKKADDEAAAKAEDDKKAAKEKQLADIRAQLGIPEGYKFIGDSENEESLRNPYNYRRTNGDLLYNSLHVSGLPGNDYTPEFNDRLYYQGYGIPISDIGNDDALSKHMQNLGMYDAERVGGGLSDLRSIYDKALANQFSNTVNSEYEKYLSQHRTTGDKAAIEALLQKGHMDVTTNEDRQSGSKRFLILNDDPRTKYQLPYKTIIVNNEGMIKEVAKPIAMSESAAAAAAPWLSPLGIPVQSLKKGGTINLNKIKSFKYGGIPLVLTDEDKQKFEEKQNAQRQQFQEIQQNREESSRRSANTEELFGDEYQLTGADKADLAALGLDVAGLISGFVPGGSVVGATTGLGSTLASAGARASREGGLTWGNIGNSAVSLAMDVGSLLPGAGNFAKAAKIARWAKYAGKGIMGVLQAKGAYDAAGVLGKLATEGTKNVTLEDWQSLLGGIKMLSGKAQQGLVNRGTTKVGGSDVSVNTRPAAGSKTGETVRLGVDEKAAKDIFNSDFTNKQQQIASKKAELDEINTTNVNSRTPDQKLALETEYNQMRSDLETDLTNKGISQDVASKLIDQGVDSSISGFQKPLNSLKFWKKDSWQSPIKTGADVDNTSGNMRVLKGDHDINNIFDRWGRSLARGQGYATKAELNNHVAGLRKSTGLDDAEAREARFTKGKKSIEDEIANTDKNRDDARAESRVKRQNVADKESELTKSEADLKNKKLDFDTKKTEYKNEKSKYNQEEADYNTKKTKYENTIASIKAKGHNNLAKRHENLLKKLTQDFDLKSEAFNKSRDNLNNAKKNFRKLGKAVKQTNADIQTAKAEYSANSASRKKLIERSKKLSVAQGKIKEKLSKASENKKVASEKLSTAKDEMGKNYTPSKLNSFKGKNAKVAGAVGAGATAASLVAASVSTAVANSEKQEKVNKMSEKDLRYNLQLLKDAVRSQEGNNKKSTEESIKRYEKALKLKSISKKANGGILKMNPGGTAPELKKIDNNITGITAPLVLLPTGSLPPLKSRSNSGNEPGITLKDIVGYGASAVTPETLGLATTLAGNKKMENLAKRTPAPALKLTYNMLTYQNVATPWAQVSAINQKRNASNIPMSSDAKLNAAVKMSQNAQYDQMEQDLFNQTGQKQNEIANANVQLANQQSALNTGVANENLAATKARDMLIHQNRMNRIAADVQSYRQFLDKMAAKGQKEQARVQGWLDKINQQEYLTGLEDAKAKLMNTYATNNNLVIPEGGKVEDIISGSDTHAKAFGDLWKAEQLKLQKKYFIQQRDQPMLKSGGSLEEKKELQKDKALYREMMEKEKAFNKLILSRSSDYNKMLIASAKSMQPLIKKMLG